MYSITILSLLYNFLILWGAFSITVYLIYILIDIIKSMALSNIHFIFINGSAMVLLLF
ncbi:MAG: hypothetical protein ACI9EK_000275 [Psychroserpens sp.]